MELANQYLVGSSMTDSERDELVQTAKGPTWKWQPACTHCGCSSCGNTLDCPKAECCPVCSWRFLSLTTRIINLSTV